MRHSSQTRFVLGIDFGTLSGRAMLVEVTTGREAATAVHEYARGVMDETLPDGRKRLAHNTALQDPADYLAVLRVTIPKVLRTAKVNASRVIGIGTDFTSCTMLPTRADGTPLCFNPRWRRNPHAWVKLWKHHAAQPEADRINAIGRQRGEAFYGAYGGRYSSEWFFAKLLETVNDAARSLCCGGAIHRGGRLDRLAALRRGEAVRLGGGFQGDVGLWNAECGMRIAEGRRREGGLSRPGFFQGTSSEAGECGG